MSALKSHAPADEAEGLGAKPIFGVELFGWGIGAQRYYKLTDKQCRGLYYLRTGAPGVPVHERTRVSLRHKGLIELLRADALTDKGKAACVDLFDTSPGDFLTKRPEAYR